MLTEFHVELENYCKFSKQIEQMDAINIADTEHNNKFKFTIFKENRKRAFKEKKSILVWFTTLVTLCWCHSLEQNFRIFCSFCGELRILVTVKLLGSLSHHSQLQVIL